MKKIFRHLAVVASCIAVAAVPFAANAAPGDHIHVITAQRTYFTSAVVTGAGCSTSGDFLRQGSGIGGVGSGCYPLVNINNAGTIPGYIGQLYVDVSVTDDFSQNVAFDLGFDNSTATVANIFSRTYACGSLSGVQIPSGTTRIWISTTVNDFLSVSCPGNQAAKGVSRITLYDIET